MGVVVLNTYLSHKQLYIGNLQNQSITLFLVISNIKTIFFKYVFK